MIRNCLIIFDTYIYIMIKSIAVVNFSFRESVRTVVEGVGEVTVYIDRIGISDEDFILMVTGCK